ncbi:MAG TPA: bifunctional phosphoribosylaminoimidazolecarboxamide formyltransferase/IMP cyclohydrolase [Bacteroidota bacterium]|jgi:phosphoribosylaminoimidazolecarboxamide formyltransferase/IMP cyclohydrolase
MNLVQIKRALISVSDKSGIVELASSLSRRGVEIISTGGTLKTLRDAGIPARSVSEVTGFPEILDGRVKTLHPAIHAALLAVTENPAHQEQLAELDITPIDLVVVNLYPFEKTVAHNGISLDQAIEQIDIGGPTILRAAAKNFKYKAALVNPARYGELIAEMEKNDGALPETLRFELAREVFRHTARYDSVIAEYLGHRTGGAGENTLPELLSMVLPKSEELRYGENPHQAAALYGEFRNFFRQLHGKELSYNNIVDIEAAARLTEEFSEPTVAIIKHTNPCGAGSGENLAAAYEKALATDSKSAFGGIVAVNKPLDMATALLIDKVFTEVIVAPDFPADVLEVLKKKRDRRLIRQTGKLGSGKEWMIRSVAGGVLVQTSDDMTLAPEKLKVVTKRAPTPDEESGLQFAWRVAKHVKSNAIVYARKDRTLGIGAGQMSRFDSSRLAAMKAGEAGLDLRNSSVASDAFFPFADGLIEAVKAGATAVIQPGGSVRDEEVISAADANGIAMLFTGIRHFKH